MVYVPAESCLCTLLHSYIFTPLMLTEFPFLLSTANCTFLELVTIAFGSCNSNVTLEADPVAFVHSMSSVLIRVNSSDSNETLGYNLCIFPQKFRHTELIGCTHNNTEVAIDVDWKSAGLTNISVFISRETGAFMGCARTSINVAG